MKSLLKWSAIFALAVIAVLLSAPHAAIAVAQHSTHLGPAVFLAGVTLNANWPNLLDVAQRTDPSGKLAKIVEILAPQNGILEDVPFFECNDGTGHKTTIRTGIPQITFRKLYGGVQPAKSTTAQVRHATGMLETYAEVDKALADMSPSGAPAFRASEESPFIQAFGKKIADTIFYGNEVSVPEGFTGLAPHYAGIAGVESGDNIVDAGGTGTDNTSIWLVQWGEDTCHGLYPRGSKAGLQTHDKGQVTVENVDGLGGRAEMYRTHYKWDAGLTLRNWKSVVRIANVDVSDMAVAANAKNLVNLMIQAAEKLDNPDGGRTVFYCNRGIRTALRIGIQEKIANNLSWETVSGRRVLMFDEFPVRRCDALLNTEARVT
jgi:hypothetical protein